MRVYIYIYIYIYTLLILHHIKWRDSVNMWGTWGLMLFLVFQKISIVLLYKLVLRGMMILVTSRNPLIDRILIYQPETNRHGMGSGDIECILTSLYSRAILALHCFASFPVCLFRNKDALVLPLVSFNGVSHQGHYGSKQRVKEGHGMSMNVMEWRTFVWRECLESWTLKGRRL